MYNAKIEKTVKKIALFCKLIEYCKFLKLIWFIKNSSDSKIVKNKAVIKTILFLYADKDLTDHEKRQKPIKWIKRRLNGIILNHSREIV